MLLVPPFIAKFIFKSLVISMFLSGILLSVGRRPLPKPAPKRAVVNIIAHARRKKRRAVIACDSS